jgi:hypothetical protein
VVRGAKGAKVPTKSDSRWQRHLRSRAVLQSAAGLLDDFTQGGTLPESRSALGYYRPPCSGLSVCGFADNRMGFASVRTTNHVLLFFQFLVNLRM